MSQKTENYYRVVVSLPSGRETSKVKAKDPVEAAQKVMTDLIGRFGGDVPSKFSIKAEPF